jgi:diguanylate cyclase (GGDEF)-like protein
MGMKGKTRKKGGVEPPVAVSVHHDARALQCRKAILRTSLLTFVVCFLGGFLASSLTYRSSLGKIKQTHQDQLKFSGGMFAKGVELAKLAKVKSATDKESAIYASLTQSLKKSLSSDPRFVQASVIRAVGKRFQYIIYGASDTNSANLKKARIINPGSDYKDSDKCASECFTKGKPVVNIEPKSGDFVSSYTPLMKGKRVIGVLVLDSQYAFLNRDIASVADSFSKGLFSAFGFAVLLGLFAGIYRWRMGKSTEKLSEDFISTSSKLNKTELELVDAMKITKEANESLVHALWTSGCLIWNGTATLVESELQWVGQVKYEPPFKWLAYELQSGRQFEDVWDGFRHEDDLTAWKRSLSHAISSKSSGITVEYRIVIEGGKVFWFSEQVSFEYDEEGVVTLVGFVSDITEQRNKDEQVRKLAYYDTVTGLINRTKIHELITEMLREKPRLSVIGIEISNFRNVNESWGPEIGDRLLHEVGNTLKEGVGNFGVAGRLAGDDFVVIVPEEASVSWLVSKIDEVCQKPTVIDGVEVAKICRIGYVTADDGETAVGIIRKANLALEIARKNLAVYPVPYKAEMSFKAKMRVELETAMRQALTDREFYLMFQPIYCNKTRKLVKAEALLRWNSSRFGAVSPGTFIPIAEESDFINALGNYVIDETARAISKINQALVTADIVISMNLSLRQLKNQSTLNSFSSALEKWNILPKNMLIEITESSIMHDASEGTAMLDQLQDRGFSLAIDDFGTGYSSLSTLASLPFNCLKIDKKFVDGIGVDRKQEAVLSTIVRLARALNLQIVAEGIEQEAQFDFLRDLDVEYSQGYYFAKPLSFEDLMALAQQGQSAAA